MKCWSWLLVLGNALSIETRSQEAMLDPDRIPSDCVLRVFWVCLPSDEWGGTTKEKGVRTNSEINFNFVHRSFQLTSHLTLSSLLLFMNESFDWHQSSIIIYHHLSSFPATTTYLPYSRYYRSLHARLASRLHRDEKTTQVMLRRGVVTNRGLYHVSSWQSSILFTPSKRSCCSFPKSPANRKETKKWIHWGREELHAHVASILTTSPALQQY